MTLHGRDSPPYKLFSYWFIPSDNPVQLMDLPMIPGEFSEGNFRHRPIQLMCNRWLQTIRLQTIIGYKCNQV